MTPEELDIKNSWFTPEYIIESARKTLTNIDLDPASCEFANRIVKADKYYTIKDDGLKQPWRGNIWLNPPYDTKNLKAFLDKTQEEISNKNINSIIMLMNATVFEKTLIRAIGFTDLLAIPSKRIKFYNSEGEQNVNRFGNVILGYGDSDFCKRFYKNFNWCVISKRIKG